ncbi:hypothetical protein SALBM217S_05201 [Streptomyces griseoloalbus]
MPPDNTDDGLRAAVALRRDHPGLPVLVLSQYIEQSYAAHLLDLGSDSGVGYLLKDRVSAVSDFVDAVTQVAAGATVVDPEVRTPAPQPPPRPPGTPSPRASARSSP